MCARDLSMCSVAGAQVAGRSVPSWSPHSSDFVRRHRERSAQGIVDAVLAEVSAYSTASMNDDDKVLIVMKVTADKEASPEDTKN